MWHSLIPRAALAGLAVGVVLALGCQDDQEASTETEAGEVALYLAPVSADELASPMRLAVGKKGEILVADPGQRMILLVDEGTLLPTSGLEVNGKPLGVAVVGKRVFVANASRRTIEVYSGHGGSYLSSFGPDAVGYPLDLAADPIFGLVFAVDGEAKQVKVFDARGRPRAAISGPGSGVDQLLAPTAVAVDPARREVYISDYGTDVGHAAVKIFDYDGTFLAEISGEGTCGMLGCSGGFSRPQGLTVDGAGKIYVTDAILAAVLVYDRETLEQVDVIGGRSSGVLRLPLDVALGLAGELYVTSNRTGTIELFSSGEAP